MARAKNWRPKFLKTLKMTGNVRASCEAAGVSRATCYRARHSSKKFADDWADAMQEALDMLELKAWERAMAHSDGLLKWILASHRRELYGTHITNKVEGEPLQVRINWDGKVKDE